MIDPSGITLPEGSDFQITQVKTGEFVVENAYDGDYEYFTGRPTNVRIGLESGYLNTNSGENTLENSEKVS